MSKRHTQGRLTVERIPATFNPKMDGFQLVGITPDGQDLMTVALCTVNDSDEANARRLVACWNACANVDTELLEQYPAPFSVLREERDRLLAASHAGKEVWRQDQARIAELMAQRDKLLYAMKHIESHGNKIGFDAVLYARAAIAESEGE